MSDQATLTPAARQATIIINPVSGRNASPERRQQLEALARSLGWKGHVVETSPRQGATVLAEQALASGVSHLVVCGGDGTIMEAVSALVGRQAVLGVVPAGTGNLFVQNLGIPVDIAQALRIALLGQPEPVDLGQANGTYFTIMAGMGLDARMARDADRQLKSRIGLLAYVGTIVRNLPGRPRRYSLSVDDQPELRVRAQSILVANLGRISGGIELVPGTDAQNGRLHVGVMKPTKLSAWLALSFHAWRGTIDQSPHYELHDGQQVTIRALSGPEIYQCDGNVFPATSELSIRILPSALRVACP